jgi:protein-disulfide isomerase
MKVFALALGVTLLCLAAGPDPEKTRMMGIASAPIRLDLYSDFTCPHCKLFHDQFLPKIVAEYIAVNPPKAYLVFHEYTLTGPGHEYSREASNYAAAAARIGKYAQVAGALFVSQESWVRTGKVWDAVAAAPQLTAADKAKIQALVKDPTVLAEVQRDLDMGNAAHVDRTPTVVIWPRGKKQTPWSYWDERGFALFRSFLSDSLK